MCIRDRPERALTFSPTRWMPATTALDAMLPALFKETVMLISERELLKNNGHISLKPRAAFVVKRCEHLSANLSILSIVSLILGSCRGARFLEKLIFL